MVAPVNVDRIIPARFRRSPHALQLDCGADPSRANDPHRRRRQAGASSTPKGPSDSSRRGFITPAPPSNRFCTTSRMSPSSAPGTPPDRPRCSWPSVAASAPFTCWSASVSARACPSTSSGASAPHPISSLHEESQIIAVHGERRLESITIRKSKFENESSMTDDPPRDLPVGAVFVFIGAEPGCSWLPEQIARDDLGYILTGIDAARSGKWPLTDREPVHWKPRSPASSPPATSARARPNAWALPWAMDRWRSPASTSWRRWRIDG